MEDTIWETSIQCNVERVYVLILIIMEDTIWGRDDDSAMLKGSVVLILIIMEDTIWVGISIEFSNSEMS